MNDPNDPNESLSSSMMDKAMKRNSLDKQAQLERNQSF